LRSAILLRRRCTIYPRAIETLPWPLLGAAGLSRLDALSREAHAICAEADVDTVRLALAARAQWSDTRRAAALLDFSGWPEEAEPDAKEVGQGRVASGALVMGSVRVKGDETGLTLLWWLLQGSTDIVTRDRAGAIALPRDPNARAGAAAAIRQRVEARGALMDRLAQVEAEVDDLVMDGLGLSPEQRTYLRARCREFPLSETVMRPRYLWSEDRKRQALRRYDDGQRYR